ncbi:MAG: Eco57I restriction-modification methylase domain-containing protein, partial [Prevotellaceae bacterium]|nr:Eco57I restriction-modification methylase domain-containing protein [Prevotellaceae bacterium]
MFTQESLKQSYNRQNWQIWLGDIFGSKVQFETQPENIEIVRDKIKSAQRFASVKLTDGKNLAVLDIETAESIQIARNRVGLRDMVIKLIYHARYHGILAFYHSANAAEYRFSFISSEPTIDADGNYSVQSTAPKRYTYVLGENEKTKTPADRLKIIADKRGNISLEDIKNAFSVETLTKEFYKELFDWYTWALQPESAVSYPYGKTEEHLIRLITRLMFVWFIKQKHLIPDKIFDVEKLQNILNDFDANDNNSGNYYNAILQNLFFATLNRPITERDFAVEGGGKSNEHYGIKTLYRDAVESTYFKKSHKEIIEMFKQVPFLNGGLFECLDKEQDYKGKIMYFDGFSRAKGKQKRAFIPNILFFDNNNGLLSILKRYNFTIEENTPTDVEVALDPELLGKVFENLLGAYNPETRETARKQSGSFYTPREIVNYMVDESLKAYLQKCTNINPLWFENLTDLTTNQKSAIYNALLKIKILDPACGSGAFPMGVLNRIVDIMEKLGLPQTINRYDLKLHLIENCIYGIDIQTIAIQISKLRFFISLVCEQNPNDTADNYGIKPLPNLETKFVAANTLIGIQKQQNGVINFENPQIGVIKQELQAVRHKHFSARTARQKKEYRQEDKVLREKLAVLLQEHGDFATDEAKQLAAWNPYDQSTYAEWFDPEWMFGLTEGFDIVIGNPPYVQLQNNGGMLAKIYENCRYKTFARTGDLYSLFYERGWQLLKPQGRLCFITSNKWMRAGYGENTRKFFVENTNPELLID